MALDGREELLPSQTAGPARGRSRAWTVAEKVTRHSGGRGIEKGLNGRSAMVTANSSVPSAMIARGPVGLSGSVLPSRNDEHSAGKQAAVVGSGTGRRIRTCAVKGSGRGDRNKIAAKTGESGYRAATAATAAMAAGRGSLSSIGGVSTTASQCGYGPTVRRRNQSQQLPGPQVLARMHSADRTRQMDPVVQVEPGLRGRERKSGLGTQTKDSGAIQQFLSSDLLAPHRGQKTQP